MKRQRFVTRQIKVDININSNIISLHYQQQNGNSILYKNVSQCSEYHAHMWSNVINKNKEGS